MAKSSTNHLGIGGMVTKISAAKIATASGADMVIANGNDVHHIDDIIKGKEVGTLFTANKNTDLIS